MEESIRGAMESLARGGARVDPHQVLTLQEQLAQVDRKFSDLRSEVSRLNALLADAKDANDALKEHNRILKEQVDKLSKTSTTSSKSPKTKKKKSTTKKNLTRKSK